MRTSFRLALSGSACVAGGLLMILSGVVAHGFLPKILDFVKSAVGDLTPHLAYVALSVVIQILLFLIGLGGLGVLAGGVLIVLGHTTTGKFIVALGGGAGFIGLAIALAYAIYTTGYTSILTHAEYWVGVLFAALGRHYAHK